MKRVSEIPYETTMSIQHTLSNFYGSWLRMSLEPDGPIELAEALVEQLKTRKPLLINNSIMLTAIYLDSRYNFKLRADEKKIARIALIVYTERS